MTPDEELKLLRADWAALVAQVSGGEGANLRRDETHPNLGGEVMQPEPVAWLDEATDCAYTRAELDGGSEQGMRPLYAAPPAAPIGEENER